MLANKMNFFSRNGPFLVRLFSKSKPEGSSRGNKGQKQQIFQVDRLLNDADDAINKSSRGRGRSESSSHKNFALPTVDDSELSFNKPKLHKNWDNAKVHKPDDVRPNQSTINLDKKQQAKPVVITPIGTIDPKLVSENTPENISCPWIFNTNSSSIKRSAVPEINLKGLVAYEHILTYELVSHYFKSFILNWIDRDFTLLEDYLEPSFVNRLAKDMSLLPLKYKLAATNLKNCELKFDLYEVKNIYMSCVNSDRTKADNAANFRLVFDNLGGVVPTYFLSKKSPSDQDLCGLIMQFNFNLYTDLDLSFKNTETTDASAKNIQFQGDITFPHDFRLEILACSAKHKSSSEAVFFNRAKPNNLTLPNMTNYMRKNNFRITDVDGYMRGNPILIDIDWNNVDEIKPPSK